MSTRRENVTTTWDALRKGDRFADGWAVETVTVDGDCALLRVRKGNRRADATIKHAATKIVTVGRAVSTAGAYVKHSARNRETGTLIEVLDLAHPDSEFAPEYEVDLDDRGREVGRRIVNRYATVCTEHSTFVTHPTLRHAISHAAAPTGWCEPCADVAEGCKCMHESGVIETPSGSCPLHGYLVDNIEG